MERLKQSTTDLPSAVWHPFGTQGCKYLRKKWMLISLCALSFLFMYCSKLYKWTSIWEQSETPLKEMTVDELIFSLSWASSPSNFTSFNSSSSAQHSVVRLEQPRPQYCVGDTLNVLVEIRDYAGHPKAYGGDFILARIHSPKLQACASGDVTDLLNGSYRVHFHLFWPGEVQVSVLLIHSSEAVKVLQKDWMKNYNKSMHMGTFRNGKKEEKSQCALRLSSDRPLCQYRKKEDGEYYACYKPHTLPCDSLSIMQSYTHPGPNLTKEEVHLLAQENTGIEIPNSFNPLTVAGCSGPFLSEDAITSCLKGKILYLLGDSTARQWIEYLVIKLKGLRIVQGSRFHSYLAVDARNNITVRWIKHAHPWLSYFESNIKTSVTVPEVLDSIEAGRGQKDVIVVIGIGQHFRPYPPEVFIRRLQSIRRAILRLHARIPQAVVVIKLENTIELKSEMIRDSNWYGYIQNLAQRKVFERLKVALVDAWDMTVAANTLAVHPNQVIISNQVALSLSYSCH
ncbi:NXPE family member 1-like [Anguilla anguilla]|uniref:NXPE family member 1-like n=1 Tax=Anguilla anguilla TaxID=7936 RepID=UPI0015AD2178|nr:NXPE family member 1-like [Anguilla anguilla]